MLKVCKKMLIKCKLYTIFSILWFACQTNHLSGISVETQRFIIYQLSIFLRGRRHRESEIDIKLVEQDRPNQLSKWQAIIFHQMDRYDVRIIFITAKLVPLRALTMCFMLNLNWNEEVPLKCQYGTGIELLRQIGQGLYLNCICLSWYQFRTDKRGTWIFVTDVIARKISSAI